ncbi:hypothetical protein AWZ03_012774 [Drosophila navojoa]|uniref:Uncharacterized protein n=1 Tax=Drosophila navojoa TaxID=7232 RepID=A0A484AYZ7_DRONA|nr:hypothetical protein AWZ03_012774 [Drosophila navojoa]
MGTTTGRNSQLGRCYAPVRSGAGDTDENANANANGNQNANANANVNGNGNQEKREKEVEYGNEETYVRMCECGGGE